LSVKSGKKLQFGKPKRPSKGNIAQAALQSHLDDARKERDDYKKKLDKSQRELKECRKNLHQCELGQASNNGLHNQVPMSYFMITLLSIVILWALFIAFQTGVSFGGKVLVAATPLDWKVGTFITLVVTVGLLALCGRSRLVFPESWWNPFKAD